MPHFIEMMLVDYYYEDERDRVLAGPDELEERTRGHHGLSFVEAAQEAQVEILREGGIEEWVREESRNLEPGDTSFTPLDTVHATFVASDAAEPARLLVVLGPSAGESDYVTIDGASEEPWASLRSRVGARATWLDACVPTTGLARGRSRFSPVALASWPGTANR